jgi:hypothetical protein
MTRTRLVLAGLLALAVAALLLPAPRARAYVEAPHSFGQVVNLSTTIILLRVESVDRAKKVVVYRKVRDLKGKHPSDVIRHNIGDPKGSFPAREWTGIWEWADVGKPAVLFHNGGQGELCYGKNWYQVYSRGGNHEWWDMSHGEPYLRRSYYGNIDRLVGLVLEVAAGKEALVPCLADSANKDDLHFARSKVQRLKASVKLDYNPKRDFVGWGGEDFRRLAGMPAFGHFSGLTNVGPGAQSVSAVDFNGDGKVDICLGGAGRVALLQNGGESLNDVGLPGVSGCRAAVWADYNGDGKPDLLVATPTGPKLFTNLGKDGFRDDTHLLPREAAYNLTCAAWIDQDGDGRPDILLGNGYYGLRLYRNKGKLDSKAPVTLGQWYVIGPFDNAGGGGFNNVYPPEREIVLTKKYPGRGQEAVWKKGHFRDGDVNNLALFANNTNAVAYVYREIDCTDAAELPCSFGSDDTLTVWLNGEKLIAQNVNRACAPDQARATLKLRKGKNQLLIKVCQGTGDWAFYFKPLRDLPTAVDWAFVDVSDEVGLGEHGIGGNVRGDTLTVCDVNGDGRQDFLYGAGTGLLVLNTSRGFVEAKDSGIAYRTGKVGPVFGDFDGDGEPDLFVPQRNGCKLFRNLGKGKFKDVTEEAGLGSFKGWATCAAWGDLDNDGKLDLVVGCLKGPNRFFRNKGDGTFEDASEETGLTQRIFNTQAVCLVDLNNDGVLDVVFNNEGQDACVLLGDPEWSRKRTPVTLQLAAKSGVIGTKVRVTNGDGKLFGYHEVSGGDGRGGQSAPLARFALAPGTYRVEARFSNGERRARELVVASSHVRAALDESVPKVE